MKIAWNENGAWKAEIEIMFKNQVTETFIVRGVDSYKSQLHGVVCFSHRQILQGWCYCVQGEKR